MENRPMIFALVTVIIGFMLAVQFQSTQEPVIRDTRDILQLRQELRKEQEKQQLLLQEIDKYTVLLDQYKESLEDQKDNIIPVMENQINELMGEAGLTEISGEGIILTIEPIFEDELIPMNRSTVSPELLRFLVNELNIYRAEEIAVGNQRVVSTTVFREVNGITHVNSRRLPPLPLKIKVLAKDAQNLHNEMVVSQSVDYFELDNLLLTSTPVNYLTLPAYEQYPRVRYMQEIKED